MRIFNCTYTVAKSIITGVDYTAQDDGLLGRHRPQHLLSTIPCHRLICLTLPLAVEDSRILPPLQCETLVHLHILGVQVSQYTSQVSRTFGRRPWLQGYRAKRRSVDETELQIIDLQNLLRTCPRLQQLRLDNVYFTTDDSKTDELGKLTLTNADIKIECQDSDCVSFLK